MSREHPPIVVGFDGSEDSRRAAEWAAAVAAAIPGTALHLVHALTLPPVPYPLPSIGVEELMDQHEAEARRALSAAQSALSAAGVTVELHVRRWLPPETLLEHAGECGAELIVVGQRGARSTRLLLGSVSSAVLRAADQQAVVVRGHRGTGPPARVLLALDGSAPAARATAAARRWFPNARFLAVNVRDRSDGPDAKALRRELLVAGFDEARLEIRQIDGPVAEALLELCESERIDLVAAGRRGLSAWRELLLGGVSEKLVQLAPCPVLLAH